jgi:hypothetical protein
MTLALLIGALVAVWVALAVLAAYWLYTDAKEAAEIRRHEAEMAAAGARAHRARQDRGRFDARDTGPNRYLRSDDRSPE